MQCENGYRGVFAQTDISHPGQYPKMANYTDQLAG